MIYPDNGIYDLLKKGKIVIDPIDIRTQVQPASVDLRLGPNFVRFRSGFGPVRFGEGYAEADKVREDLSALGYVTVRAGEFILAHTLEHIELPADIAARVEGRSSLGRLGITMHVTAGYIDPGFKGQITLEVANLSTRDVQIPIEARVCQIVFESMQGRATRPYGSKGLGSSYQDQKGAVTSR